jgi:hypothetical protein
MFPREERPLLLPFCCFRYFVFAGINITTFDPSSLY